MRMKRAMACGLSILAVMGALFACKATAEASGKITGKTAEELVAMFEKGFNMGNTFDATGGKKSDIYSYETSWGNPKITKELIQGVKEAGFTVLRLPVTWQAHISSDGTNKLDEAFLERVKEVVDWAFEEDLFVILNLHHEDWYNRSDFTESYKEIEPRYVAVWEQLADFFGDYDQRLIFEAINEPRAKGTSIEWNGNKDGFEAVNYLNQRFVEVVRGSKKAFNRERALMVPGYAASNSKEALNAIAIPTWEGKEAKNIIISVHCYSPYNFCLSDAQNTFDPKNSADTSDITRMVKDLKALFLDKGIPVIIGECGCTNTKDNYEERIKWFEYFGKITRENGIPAIVWDNGVNGKSGGENHSYINRKTGEQVAPELIGAFLGTYTTPEPEPENLYIDFEPKVVDGQVVTKSAFELGFVPGSLRGQAKVNHTEGAPVGYSLKADGSLTNGLVKLNIDQYIGKIIRVKAYIYSDENEVSFGIMGENDSVMLAKSKVNGEWTELGADLSAERLPNEEGSIYLYFKGAEGKDYYIDDLSVEMIDEAEANLSNKNANKTKSGIITWVAILCGAAVVTAVVTLKKRKHKSNG